MPANAETTQMQLILAAEQLFGTKGVDAVSLREINALAGQKNTSAVRYHFGDKAGIIDAILRERMTLLNRLRLDAFNRLIEEQPQPPVQALVELLAAPLVDKVLGTDDEPPVEHWRYYIQLLQQLASVRSKQVSLLALETDYNATMRAILEKMQRACADLSPELFEQRRKDLLMYTLNTLCERVMSEQKGIQPELSREAFYDNMIKVGTAMLTAPV